MKRTLEIQAIRHRAATVEFTGEGDARKFHLSISSVEPVLSRTRSGEQYYEVLDHSAKGMDETRLKAGLPILYNHDTDQPLGCARSYTNDGTKLRVSDIVWSSSEFAKTKRADAESGAIPFTSVGYQIKDGGEEIGERGGIPIYKFRWSPHEGSILPIPADVTVGSMRSYAEDEFKKVSVEVRNIIDSSTSRANSTSNKSNLMVETNTPAVEQKPAINVVEERKGAISEFKARCKRIDEFTAALKNPQWRSAAAAIGSKHKEGEANFEEFRTEALNSFDGVTQSVDTPDIGLTEKEARRFSVMSAARSIMATGKLSGFEKECSEATQKRLRLSAKGDTSIFIPNEVAVRDLYDLTTRANQNATTFTAGGATVQNQYGPMIEILNNAMVLNKMGITMLSGIVGDLVFPQQTGGTVAYWVSETGALTDSAATFAQKAMTPHRCGATVPFTTQFLAQSSISAEAFLRTEMMTRLGLLKDLAGLEGTGNSGQPLGLKNSGVQATVTFAGASTWANVIKFETDINTANADIGSMGFILSSAAVGKWKGILRASAAGAKFLIDDDMTANGYRVERTNQITGNIAYFGVWNQLINASWAGQEWVIDPYTLKKSGQVEITVNELTDFLTRQPLAFDISTDSAAQ